MKTPIPVLCTAFAVIGTDRRLRTAAACGHVYHRRTDQGDQRLARCGSTDRERRHREIERGDRHHSSRPDERDNGRTGAARGGGADAPSATVHAVPQPGRGALRRARHGRPRPAAPVASRTITRRKPTSSSRAPARWSPAGASSTGASRHLKARDQGPERSVVQRRDRGRGRGEAAVKTGDIIIIPAGMPHGWVDITDHVDYLSVRPDPDRVLPAG